jgi:serine protease Do
MGNRYNISVILMLLIVLQMLGGCSGCSQSGIRKRAEQNSKDGSPMVYTEKEPSREVFKNNDTSTGLVTLNQLFKQYQPAVFMVFTTDGEKEYQGTGFFISSDGIAVSNYHVFEGTTHGSGLIITAGGHELKIDRVLSESSIDDYIIFKVKLTGNVSFTPIPVASADPEIGEDVFAIGNPYGLEHTLSNGIISGFRQERKLIQTTAEITHGSSGGPLLNMNGEVVGITTAGMGEANLNFAVNIQILNLVSYL